MECLLKSWDLCHASHLSIISVSSGKEPMEGIWKGQAKTWEETGVIHVCHAEAAQSDLLLLVKPGYNSSGLHIGARGAIRLT